MSYMLFFFVDIVSLLTVTVVNFLFSQMSLLFKDYYYVYLFCVQYMYMYIFICFVFKCVNEENVSGHIDWLVGV